LRKLNNYQFNNITAKNKKLTNKLSNDDPPFLFTKQLLSSRESNEKLIYKNNDILSP
jgi:hypothetical protein